MKPVQNEKVKKQYRNENYECSSKIQVDSNGDPDNPKCYDKREKLFSGLQDISGAEWELF